jgi:hypothetical protein
MDTVARNRLDYRFSGASAKVRSTRETVIQSIPCKKRLLGSAVNDVILKEKGFDHGYLSVNPLTARRAPFY